MKKGFTLLELLTVVIIIAILVSIALPQFFRVTERTRATEGVNVLGALRSAQLRYYAEHGFLADNVEDLDVDLPGNLRFFNKDDIHPLPANYIGGNEEIVTIQRNTVSNPGYGNYTLAIQSDGDITCTGGMKCPPGF